MAREKLVMKECKGCGDKLEANADNFYRRRADADGLNSRCKKCIKKSVSKDRYEDIEEPLEQVERINSRNHQPIPINKPCVLIRLTGHEGASFKGKRVKGKFIKVYPSFLLFEMQCGTKECFRKNDLGVEWLVEKRA